MAPESHTKVKEVLNSGYIGQGERVEEFERTLSNFFGPGPCNILAVNSCTSSLQLALHLIDDPGGEVLTSPLNCFAGASVVLAAHMRPRWLDVDDMGNIDLLDVASKLSPSTVAVLFPHLCGMPVNLRRLYATLHSHTEKTGKKVWVIEDCAHALGSHYNGDKIGRQHIGQFGPPYPWTIKCFSFQAVKVLTTGDGGALILPNEEMLERAKLLRWYGLDRTKDRYTQDISEAGFKYQMNDIAAAIGLANIEHTSRLLDWQRDNWNYYQKSLCTCDRVCMWWSDGSDSACSLFPLWVEDKKSFMDFMLANGIEVAPPHIRADKYSCMKPYLEPLRNVDDMENHLVVIPAGWWVNDSDRTCITDSVLEWDKNVVPT